MTGCFRKKFLERQLGITYKAIILVAFASHIKKTARLFERVGLVVTPYPVDFRASVADLTPMSFIPGAYVLKDIEFSLHKMMGRLYYSIF
jgi:uncharacterized SAM-binding protein YcdF (DUF218 family)